MFSFWVPGSEVWLRYIYSLHFVEQRNGDGLNLLKNKLHINKDSFNSICTFSHLCETVLCTRG